MTNAKSSLRPLLALALLPLLAGATCKSTPAKDPRASEQADIHYDLGVQAQTSGDVRTALTEYQKALEDNPDLAVAHNALGIVLHVSFRKLDEAIVHYRRAVELNPKFSDAWTNLANVYLDQARYDEAIPLYERALGDMLYKTPFIAENNLGWCYYKKGDTQVGIDHIRSALVVNPKFCLGHRNLGVIYSETGQPEKAAESFKSYVRHCADQPDAHHRFGVAVMKLGDQAGARKEFEICAEKGKDSQVGDECQKLLDLLSRQ